MKYVATIGFFDGVHIGHSFLLHRLISTASDIGLQSAVVTFFQHPKQCLLGIQPDLITSYEERMARIKATGVNEIFCFHFEVIKGLSAEEFMMLLHHQCGVEVLLMGYDHRFGSDKLTDWQDYQRIGTRVGMRILSIPQSPDGDMSSSKIRRALSRGDVASANKMLGVPFSLEGEVMHGRGLGRSIDFPTANIRPPEGHILPKEGVYLAQVDLLTQSENGLCATTDERKNYPAVVNIGTNPTVRGKQTTIEAHLLDYDGDLYGAQVKIRLLQRIRDEICFANLSELQQQIREDIEKAQNMIL